MKIAILISAVVLAFILLFQRKQSDSAFNSEPSRTDEVTLESIEANLDQGAVLVDVRTPAEFAQEHAQGAINIPLQQLQRGEFGPLKNDQTLYVYCQSGNRSAEAIQLLNQAGYENTVDLTSLDRWKQLGGETSSE